MQISKSAEPATTPSRQRLLTGMAAALREKGFKATTVADVVRHAKVSRRTFYEEFSGREQCYVALLEQQDRRVVDAVRTAVRGGSSWRDQVHQAIEAYVDVVAADPQVTLSWIRDLPTLDLVAVETERRSTDTMLDLMRELSSGAAFRSAGLLPLDETTARLLVGGLQAVTAAVLEEEGPWATVTPTLTRVACAMLQESSQVARQTL
ncbi:TetR/AcrR family transcriptional regulator [Kineococcus endophyticus]|uniref:TetR/AcrR family transcriptional regulator n=1 Tax=Kineococcus endophyticus TaxID=1181883 RepID=A0ABV3P7Q0_9ACTN